MILRVTGCRFSTEGATDAVLAFADVELEGTIVVKRCKVLAGRGGQPFFSFPTREVRERCPDCGRREAAWHHKFCPDCGRKMPPPGPPRLDAKGFPFVRFDLVAPKSFDQRMEVAEAVLTRWLAWKEGREGKAS